MRQLFSVRLGVVLIAVLVIATGASPSSNNRSPQVGVADEGRNAIEFVGHVEQVGINFESYGYITHVDGLDDASLFATSNPLQRNETTARITFHSILQASQSFAVLAGSVSGPPPTSPSLFDVDSFGSMTFYFTPSGANRAFTDPSTFELGDSIAVYDFRFQDAVAALVGVDPNRGVISGNGELCQQSNSDFTLNGKAYRLGRAGLFQRVTSHGWSVRTGVTAAGPTSFTNYAGNTQVFLQGHCSTNHGP